MLGGLQRDADPGQRAELPGPHARRVHHHLGLDPALAGQHGADPAPVELHPGGGHAFDDPHAALLGALGQRGGHADRVGPSLVGHVERGQHVVGPGQRPHARQFPRGDLHVLDAEPVHPGGLPPERLLPLRAGGQGQVPDRAEPGGVPGLRLQLGVQVPGVPAEEQCGLVGHPGRGDQPGRVPGRTGGQPVLLQQHYVRPAQLGQVVGDAAAGHPAADDDHLSPVGQPRIARHSCSREFD